MTPPQPSTKAPAKKLPFLLIAAVAAFAAWRLLTRPEFRYAGTLEATKVDLSAQLSSTIKEVKVQEGDKVSPGEEVVSLVCDDVKVAADLANINYERTSRLSKAGSASQEAMDAARNKKQDLDVRLGWCSLRSPISGTVLSRYHEPGELVGPGTKILTLADVRDIWAYIYVPQPDVARLKPGMRLSGRLPELGDRVFDGTILKINDEAEFTPKNVQTREERTRLVFGVKVGFKESNADEVLKPGMTIEVVLSRRD